MKRIVPIVYILIQIWHNFWGITLINTEINPILILQFEDEMLVDDTDFGAGALFGVQRLHTLQIRQEVQGILYVQ